jgi:hypothetical protein
VGAPPYAFDDRERAVAQWTFDHGQVAGRGTSTLPGAGALYLPLESSGRVVGVIGLPLTVATEFRDPARRRLLESLAGQTAAALERLVRRGGAEDRRWRSRPAASPPAELAVTRHALASIRGRRQHPAQDFEPRPRRHDLAALCGIPPDGRLVAACST